MILEISTQAELDILEAAIFLEGQKAGLALALEEALDKAISSLQKTWTYQVKYSNIRTYRVRPFNYYLHYRANGQQLRIEALVHGKSTRQA